MITQQLIDKYHVAAPRYTSYPTVPYWDTAFPDLNKCVILHCYSSNNKASQKLGRCLNYVEGENAEVHIICLKGTRDEQWVASGLAEFDKTKIIYENVHL